jgi:hypothetical protein
VAACQGCHQRVYALADGLHDALADGGGRHFCTDIEKRETVTMSQEQYSLRCTCCGSRDVAESSWGRLVDFSDDIWMSPEPWHQLQEHVCASQQHEKRSAGPRPVWEAFRD